MDDLVTFLRERLAEDERIATAARSGYFRPEVLGTFSAVGDMRHVLRHNPARVLADVDAKRRIIGLCDGGAQYPDYEGGYQFAWEDTLRLLALPYASHPDYRAEWTP
jgi:hypothetical protein